MAKSLDHRRADRTAYRRNSPIALPPRPFVLFPRRQRTVEDARAAGTEVVRSRTASALLDAKLRRFDE